MEKLLKRTDFQHVKPLVLIALLGCAFFYLYTIGLHPGQTFGSPDETANAFFARHFAETGTFRVHEPLEEAAGGLLHPRSMRVVGDYIVPASWLGLPLMYGLLIKIFGSAVLPFLTAFFSVVTSFAFFALLRRLFSQQIAWIGTLLFFLQPVFWFYNNRPLWHNTLFTNALIGAWFFFVRWLEMRKWRDAIGFGLTLGIALIIRTSEAPWVLLAFALFWLLMRVRLHWRQAAVALFCLLLCFVPIAWYQQITYGSVLTSGYTIETDAVSVAEIHPFTAMWQTVGTALFPFGIQLEKVGQVASAYFLSFLVPWVILGCFGLLLCLQRGERAKRKSFAFALAVGFTCLWLMLSYGSFTFQEFLDPSVRLFGSSYLRYALPGLMLLLPFLAVGLRYLARLSKHPRLLFLLLLIPLLGFSFSRIFVDPLYGLALHKKVQQSVAEYNTATVLEHVESDAVLLARDQDKVFWPQRRVIGYNTLSAEIQRAASGVRQHVPVYAIVWGEQEAELLRSFAHQRGEEWRLVTPLEADLALYTLLP